jgi:ribosome assembly protein YihI (activator of Der GTPase)
MTHTKDEALKLALEYLEDSDNYLGSIDNSKPIAAIKQALADSALERMTENARELGLMPLRGGDYESAPSQLPTLSEFLQSSAENKVEVMERVIDKAIAMQQVKEKNSD